MNNEMIFKGMVFSKKEKIQLVIFSSLLFFLLIPKFIIRAGIVSFVFVFLLNTISEIKKETVSLFLFLFYCLAYIYPPYFISFHQPQLRILSLVLLFIFGLFWAYHASSSLKLKFKLENKFMLIVLSAMIYVINYKPLGADIPWRGDEDYHVGSVAVLSKFIFSYIVEPMQKNIFSLFPILAILSIVMGVVFLRYKISTSKKIIILIFLSVILFLRVILFTPPALVTIHEFALRYPFISRWFSLFFVFPNIYGEISLYRIIPFLSSLFTAFFLFYKFNEAIKSGWESLFLAFSMITVPLLYFYSSLLYLEMPIVLLMTICVFDIKSIIFLESKELLTRPSWYCLLLISFLKETVLVFLMVIICVRIIYQVKAVECSKKKLLYELKNGFLLVSPLFIYLFFRLTFSSFRGYGLGFYNLFNVSNYFLFGRGLFEQLGILSIITIAGLFLLFKKDRLLSGIILLLFLALGCFFIVDGGYIGYSRWNLYLIPIVFLAAFSFIVSLRKYFRRGIIFSLMFSNVFLSPFHLDGIRFPNWGSPKTGDTDSSECVYPYDRAFKYLSRERGTEYLLVMGYYYPYRGFYYYVNKYNFHPPTEELQFGSRRFDKDEELAVLNYFFFEYTKLKNHDTINAVTLYRRQQLLSVDTILYHSVNNIDLDEDILYGGIFKVIKKISNSEHSLYILRKVI